jgi:uncharacterized repeat protein (TIGR03803 family)
MKRSQANQLTRARPSDRRFDTFRLRHDANLELDPIHIGRSFVLLAGCSSGGSQIAPAGPAQRSGMEPASPSFNRTGYKPIYSFQGTGGAYPNAGLTALNSVLYGTTAYGGVGQSNDSGTVYRLSP